MGRLCLGLYGPTYFGGFSPFLNWWKTGAAVEIVRSPEGNISGKAAWDAGYFDADAGELANPLPADADAVIRLFYGAPTQALHASTGYDFSGMQWTVKWDGTGNLTFGGLTSGSSFSIDNVGRVATCTFGSDPGNTWITITTPDKNDPPRNIRVYQTQYADNVDAGEIFNPDWLGQIREFAVLRCMDWQQTNNSGIVDFEDIAGPEYQVWGSNLSGTSNFGPKGGMPLAIIAALAREVAKPIWVCIPHQTTDSCVQSVAEYFRDNVASQVFYEFSNEYWNFGFQHTTYFSTQGNAIWPGDGARHLKWGGYRSAQCMAIIRGVYNDRSRWRGVISTQTVSASATNNNITGIDYFLANEGPGLARSDLYDYLAVTGYFGDVVGCQQPSAVTRANPGVVTQNNHGLQNGDLRKFSVNSGMVELDGVIATVANRTTNTYELQGIDTSGYGAWVSTTRNYTAPGPFFVLMDDSEADDPENPYDLFNAVMAESWLTGTGTWDGGTITTSVDLAQLIGTYWPAQKAIADANGWRLIQYEGGNHFVGDSYLNGFGGHPQFTEFLLATGHAAVTAGVYRRGFEAFLKMGGLFPSKFVEAGLYSQFGTWAGMKFVPGDETNPVWQLTRHMNDSATPIQFTLRLTT